MTDIDKGSKAWEKTPGEYLAARERGFTIPPHPFSVYVAMRDGCRLAVDVYLPQPAKAAAASFPTLLILTPYYRRFKVTGSGVEPNVLFSSLRTRNMRTSWSPYSAGR